MKKYKYEEFLKRPEIDELKDCYWDMNCLAEGCMIMETYHKDRLILLDFTIGGENGEDLVGIDFINKMDTAWVCNNITRPLNLIYRSFDRTEVLKKFEYYLEYE